VCARTEKVYEQSFFVVGSGLISPFHDLRAEDVPGKKRLAAFQEIRGEIQFKIRPADGVAATGREASSSILSNPYQHDLWPDAWSPVWPLGRHI
jgi:hypothetical protein